VTNGRIKRDGNTEQTAAAHAAMSFPVEVFHVFHKGDRKGEKATGRLLSDATLEVGGRLFGSPSGAGSDLAGYPVNGLEWWRYRNPLSGHERPIADLRRRGLIP